MTEYRFLPSAFRHGVEKNSFYECFEDSKRLITRSTTGSYQCIGQTHAGAILHIAFWEMKTEKVILVFHGFRGKRK